MCSLVITSILPQLFAFFSWFIAVCRRFTPRHLLGKQNILSQAAWEPISFLPQRFWESKSSEKDRGWLAILLLSGNLDVGVHTRLCDFLSIIAPLSWHHLWYWFLKVTVASCKSLCQMTQPSASTFKRKLQTPVYAVLLLSFLLKPINFGSETKLRALAVCGKRLLLKHKQMIWVSL